MQDRVKPSAENDLLLAAHDKSLSSHALAAKISMILSQMKETMTDDINMQDQTGMTALHLLITRGETEAVKILLEAGAKAEITNDSEFSAFAYAILSNNFDITSLLIEHHVKITHPLMLEILIKQQDANDSRVRLCLDALHKQYPKNQAEFKSVASASQEIVIIPFMLDTNRLYESLDTDQKIDLLATRIKEVCEILKNQKPNATVIIAWREYGIRDIGRRSISDESRKNLKAKMKAISADYPNLIIIAGTVLTRKEKKIKDLPQILHYYDELHWLETLEKTLNDAKEEQHLAFHRDQIIQLQDKKLNNDQKIIVTANKARIYYHDTEKRHGKVAPYNETIGLDNAVYQPGKGKNLNPIIKISDNLSIAVSICREMQPGFNMVKKMHKKDDIPLLHFVLSHSIPLPLESIDATHAAIHLDRCYDPLFVMPRILKRSDVTISVYPISVHEKIEHFTYQVQPVYPVQYKILDRIDEELDKTFHFFKKADLESLKKKTMEMLFTFYISEENYQQYINYIKNKTWFIKPNLIADIISMIKQGDVQHGFNLAKEENLRHTETLSNSP